MATVKTRHLQLIGLPGELDQVLDAIMRLGCIEVLPAESLLEEEEYAAVLEKRTFEVPRSRVVLAEVRRALAALDKYAPEKRRLFARRPSVTRAELFSEAVFEEAAKTAGEIIAREEQIAALSRGKQNADGAESRLPISMLEAEIASYADCRRELRLCADRCAQEAARDQAKERLLYANSVFLLEGEIQSEKCTAAERAFEGLTCAWEFGETETEQALRSGRSGEKVFRPLRYVTEYVELLDAPGV